MWYFLINNKPILIRSMLALSRTNLLEKLEKAKEAKRRRLETTSTATSTGNFTAPARKSSVS